ncbi:hypothetical protein [Allomuricauda sp. M10]|uniref:hypothetical protein n=1 Tax=Allomuricauda sp. M10 TaxID=2683292 RepID=UPI001D18D578|nr:hypothetical protein [Muricauda sp. M10]
MMRILLYITFLFTSVAFGQSLADLQLLAQQQAGIGSGLLPPPLESNANPELITDNAAAFPPDELNEVDGTTGNLITPQVASLSSVFLDDGYEGDYMVRVTSTSNSGYNRAEHVAIPVTSSTVYEFVLVYKHNGLGASGRFRVSDGTTIFENNALSSTSIVELSGEFTTGASATNITVSVWCQRPFASATGNEVLDYKLTIKQKE